MLADLMAMDAALALGPVRIECNVCGRYHDVTPVASSTSFASATAHGITSSSGSLFAGRVTYVPNIGGEEWDDCQWFQCLAERCALGLRWSQENTSAAQLRAWTQELQTLYAAEEGWRKTIAFVYEAYPEAFAGFSSHSVCAAMRCVLASDPYEYMFVSHDDVAAIKSHVLSGFRHGTFPVRSPWMLASDSRLANRFMARRRVEALLAADDWPAVLAGARGLIKVIACACSLSRESDGFVASSESLWKAFAASSAILALHAQLEKEYTSILPGEGREGGRALPVSS